MLQNPKTDLFETIYPPHGLERSALRLLILWAELVDLGHNEWH
jgi:hypothetical protein